MDIEFRLWLKKDGKKVFGEGPRAILKQVEEQGSLRQAAINLNMSYSKAWGTIKMLEENLGFRIIEKSIGGFKGGGSLLTPEGKYLLSSFEKLDKEVEEFLKDKAKKILGNL